MDNNININKKNKYLWVVIVFVLLLVGGTLASVIYNVLVSNGRYNTVTTCLEVDYDISNEDGTIPITGDLFPSRTAFSGLNGKVGLKINDSCSLEGIGTLTLNIVDASATLIQTVDAHCENSKTLETLTNYSTESDCTAIDGNIWVTDGTALKYAVYDTSEITGETEALSVGYVNTVGSIDIYNDFSVTKTEVNYYIYIWLDGNISDNSYVNLSFNGNVSASVVQKPEEVVPSFDDHTLMITSYTCNYGTEDEVTVGDNPYFTYTGDCEVIDDGDGDWRIKFLTDGDFESTLNIPIDAFLVGGGGGGAEGASGGIGGGGGITTTTFANLKAGTPYSIDIGDGGGSNSDGLSTTAFDSIAFGGYSGSNGGSGGSGGGGYISAGGSDGTSGEGFGGTGQGTTTREFGEDGATLYSGGGGGGSGWSDGSGGSGGSGGGANGGADALANTGGGGGGGYINDTTNGAGGSGGSGIVVIRNTNIDVSDVLKLPGVDFSFAYTGFYTIVNENSGNWKIKFLTDGEFTLDSDMKIDAFLVGGGGGGAEGASGGIGGGGGITTTTFANLEAGTPYSIDIGDGGGSNSDGLSTTAFGSVAFGGYAGSIGGSGGSGGGGYASNGGSDGTSGEGFGGTGQGTTTREFGEEGATLYSGGGGGGSGWSDGSGGSGGSGGGANDKYNALANTGGGGGGGYINDTTNGDGGSGGSGIVVIRNTRIDVSDVSKLPGVDFSFTYTGFYTVVNENSGNWKIKFLTDGDFISDTDLQIDAFLVGGGGGGAEGASGGIGGGGGITTTIFVNLEAGTPYSIDIGDGGGSNSDGLSTTAFNESVLGGYAGSNGGSGGSGGGAYNSNGGSDGASGEGSGGTGQGTTTREFGEDGATLYSGGGGGGSGWSDGSGGSGGSGGGANDKYNALANTGGGGGGGYINDTTNGAGGSGGSGIVIIRNKR